VYLNFYGNNISNNDDDDDDDDDVDDDYVKFLEKLEKTEPEVIPTPEVFLEEIEAREKQMKGDLLRIKPDICCF